MALTEGQLFECTTKCLREEYVDENNLIGQEGDVGDEVAPANILQPDGVDECGEETGKPTP